MPSLGAGREVDVEVMILKEVDPDYVPAGAGGVFLLGAGDGAAEEAVLVGVEGGGFVEIQVPHVVDRQLVVRSDFLLCLL